MTNAKEAFEERKQKLIQQGQWRGNRKSVFISVGNTHEKVENPKPASDSKNVNAHRWAMFVCLSNGKKEETGNYVESVTYHLHPTFKPSVIKVTQAPFLLSRIGWGYFEMEIDIVFKKSTCLAPMKVTHELSFEQAEKKSQFEILIAADEEPAEELSVKMAQLKL